MHATRMMPTVIRFMIERLRRPFGSMKAPPGARILGTNLALSRIRNPEATGFKLARRVPHPLPSSDGFPGQSVPLWKQRGEAFTTAPEFPRERRNPGPELSGEAVPLPGPAGVPAGFITLLAKIDILGRLRRLLKGGSGWTTAPSSGSARTGRRSFMA